MTYNYDMEQADLRIGAHTPVLGKWRAGSLAWTVSTVSILVATAALGVSIWGVAASGAYRSILTHQTLNPFITAGFAILGALVAARHPRNPTGWIFVTVGTLFAFTSLTTAIRLYGSNGSPLHELAVWFSNWVWIPAATLPLIFVLLIFPDGQLPSPRWRFVAWSAALGLFLTVLAVMLYPGLLAAWEPEAVPSGPGAPVFMQRLAALGALLLAIGFIGSFAGFFTRFRRSAGLLREQMKWLAYPVVVLMLGNILAAVSGSFWPKNPLVYELNIVLTNLAILGIAAAAAIAILRYRLYDINLIINRTLVYTVLLVVIGGLYGLVVAAFGAMFQTRSNLSVSLLAAGLAAILVQPLRDRLQRGANRLMYGERDDPYAVLSRLSRQLEGSLSPEATLPAVVETVAQALKLPYVAIALKQGGELKIAASYGLEKGAAIELPLIYQGKNIGKLRLAARSPNEPFTPSERRLLQDIARHIGVTAHTVLLTLDLRRLAEDLQRSREELVKSREEERRRLRRDLHDELGPQLASLKLNLDVARKLVSRDPSAAEALLIELRTQSQVTIADIRRLAYDLRPPALDELGLNGAIQQYVTQIENQEGPQIHFDSPKSLPPLPAAVEVAAYRIALEALANMIRHSQAKNCAVSISIIDRHLQVLVCDDGLGIPNELQPGVGLSSMRARAAELGGTCVIAAQPQGGTRVLARLPLG